MERSFTKYFTKTCFKGMLREYQGWVIRLVILVILVILAFKKILDRLYFIK